MDTASNSLLALMDQGGWVMWVLLAFSVLSLATTGERIFALRRARTDVEPLLIRLQDALLKERSSKKAIEICELEPGAAARVGKVGLRRFGRSAAQLEKSLERAAVVEIRRLNRGLLILATTANVAPLLGFLGTVTGMIASFDVLWRTGLSQPQLVALGISEALVTTAAGLVVAVPTQILYNALAARAARLTSDIETVANFLLEMREEMK